MADTDNLIDRSLPEIRIAILGAGKMGRIHARAIQQIAAGLHEPYYKPGVGDQLHKIRLCALGDIAAEAPAEFAHVPYFTDLQQLIETAVPHILVIATPTVTHFEFTSAALRQGIHCFVEKPLVTNRGEMDELSRLARQHQCRLLSGHVERYNPVAIKIVDLLGSGQVTPQGYRFQRRQRHDPRIADDIIIDKVIHDLDLAQYFFGAIASAELLESRRHDGAVHEARVALTHTSELAGELFVSWLVDEDVRERQVGIEADEPLRGDFVAKTLSCGGQDIPCDVPGMIEAENNQIKDELVDFISYASRPDPDVPVVEPLLTLDEIGSSVRLIERLIAACGCES